MWFNVSFPTFCHYISNNRVISVKFYLLHSELTRQYPTVAVHRMCLMKQNCSEQVLNCAENRNILASNADGVLQLIAGYNYSTSLHGHEFRQR
jgi:hypothetical protein